MKNATSIQQIGAAIKKAQRQTISLDNFPGRIFLDTSTLQTLQDYGEFIYDGGEISQQNKIWSVPDGFENVEALRKVIHIGRRGTLQLVLSPNSIQEVLDRGRSNYLQWALEMLDYWESCLSAYEDSRPAFSGHGVALSAKLRGGGFGYLSAKDANLIRDALLLECDVFLTMERKLPRNASHIERELEIKVLQPIGYWNLLRPWAAHLA